jgi:hypothetical protein
MPILKLIGAKAFKKNQKKKMCENEHLVYENVCRLNQLMPGEIPESLYRIALM